MVALIEDQIHQFLKNQEEERCRALEAEYNKHKETNGKKVKRREISKPLVRPSDDGLCQEDTFLMMVSEYDYDLSHKSFQAYCDTRGILHVAGEPGSVRWKYLAEFRKTKALILLTLISNTLRKWVEKNTITRMKKWKPAGRPCCWPERSFRIVGSYFLENRIVTGD